ncbi:ROK family protein [Oenococcus alcoholitolerans]|uniref:ROK family protein n=1 Tax=Oenococcus alcoholitolerans TaxID=931074 RepID=UPI003F6E8E56
MQKKYLAIDIGGTKMKFGILDQTGEILHKDSVITPTKDFDSFISSIKAIVNQYKDQVSGIAFSVPGKIDHKDDRIYGGGAIPFLDKKSFPDILKDITDLPVTVENDGKAAALAEVWLGNLHGVKNGFLLTLGTGVGGGIVVDHKLLYGDHFQAGELSFMTDWHHFDMDNMLGRSASAVMMIEDIADILKLKDRHDGLTVFKEINSGNPEALKIFHRFCRYIAAMINNVQTVIDGSRVVIGGGISAQEIVIKTIQEEYDQLRKGVTMLDIVLAKPEIKAAKFRNDANLYGALYRMLSVNHELDLKKVGS